VWIQASDEQHAVSSLFAGTVIQKSIQMIVYAHNSLRFIASESRINLVGHEPFYYLLTEIMQGTELSCNDALEEIEYKIGFML
jgi:hypothetical protein